MTRSSAELVVAGAILIGSGLCGWVVRDLGVGPGSAAPAPLAAVMDSPTTPSAASASGAIAGICWTMSDHPACDGDVSISRGGEVVARTAVDQKGRFNLPDLEPGTYDVALEVRQAYPNHKVNEFGVRRVRVERGKTADGSVRATWWTVADAR